MFADCNEAFDTVWSRGRLIETKMAATDLFRSMIAYWKEFDLQKLQVRERFWSFSLSGEGKEYFDLALK